ncbi:hypothetical protein NPL7_02330 [Metamycoplasma hyosynoviae]|uniref:PDxFFG protein n=1 Tax=Metamycoplasma hyosynoviae TaxID=29559 RepID=UPI000461AAD6|nr:PDxFFG protein [Metamycoplasma hyosynoviae]KDE41709.1 hypothetical protein NPL7_02330 [Metamycoplasma hyosynoviae]KDE41831.1 hypothetical protein NPL3_03140 [Metamycoplasma hyosynoviae]KDE42832.1 hypothetical protein NPL5_03665 [Metamycoplasma hyosynoviae]KDE44271.1 hypothetical protein NPL6_01985 [Metamycoplasma hyosynoviae]
MKSKKKFNFKTKVWHKYAISLGSLILATTVTLSSIYAYSKCSPDRLGRKNPTDPYYLQNKFVQTKDAKIYFVTSDKDKKIADIDITKNIATWIDEKNPKKTNTKSVEEYIKHYYDLNKRYPVLNIRYGSFDFFNEYLEAVSAKDFFDFTKWFMFNVSWGPEIVTLKEFSIVKGVEMKGNSITLGSHSDLNKEYMTIKFYPDAFFGTLAVYSELSGRGNANDALVYKLNEKLLTNEEIEKLLKNTPGYNAFANMSDESVTEYTFRNITDIRSLIGTKVFAIKKPNWDSALKESSLLSFEKSRYYVPQDYLMLVGGKTKDDAKKELAKQIKKYESSDKHNLLKNLKDDSLEEKIVSNVTLEKNTTDGTYADYYLRIWFADGSFYNLFETLQKTKLLVKLADQEKELDLDNIMNLHSAIRHAKEKYEKEVLRANQSISVLKEKITSLESDIKSENEDYVLNKKDLEASKTAKEQEIASLEAQSPTDPTAINKAKAELEEIKKELAKLETTHTNNLNKLNTKLKTYRDELSDLIQFLDIKVEEYTALVSSNVETGTNNDAKSLFVTKVFEIAKNLQHKFVESFNKRLKISLKIEEKDILEQNSVLIVYNNDLAYQVNQIITTETLKETAQGSFLNWRDFYNLKNFLYDKKEKSDNEFYVYSPFFKSIVQQWNDKNPGAKVKFEYQTLLTELKALKEQDATLEQQIETIDAETKSIQYKNIGKIYLELLEAFTPGGELKIDGFTVPGTKTNKFPLGTVEKWKEFCIKNFDVLPEYLQLVKGKWDSFYSQRKTFIETNKALYDEIVALEKQEKDLMQQYPNWSSDWTIYNTYIKPIREQKEAKIAQWKSKSSTNGYVDYEEVAAHLEFESSLTNSITWANEHKTKEENYYALQKQRNEVELKIHLLQFKMNFFLNSIDKKDGKLTDLYLEFLQKYEELKSEMQTAISDYQDKVKEYFSKKHKFALELTKLDEDKFEKIASILELDAEKIELSKGIIPKVAQKKQLLSEIATLQSEIKKIKEDKYSPKFNDFKSMLETNISNIDDIQKDSKKQIKSDKELLAKNKKKISENEELIQTTVEQNLKTFLEFENSKLNELNTKLLQTQEKLEKINKNCSYISDTNTSIIEDANEITEELVLESVEGIIEKANALKEQLTEINTFFGQYETTLDGFITECQNKINDSTLPAEIKAKYTELKASLESQKSKITSLKSTLESKKASFYNSSYEPHNTIYTELQSNSEIATKTQQINTKNASIAQIQSEIQDALAQGAIEVDDPAIFTEAEKYVNLKAELEQLEKEYKEKWEKINQKWPTPINFIPGKSNERLSKIIEEMKAREEEILKEKDQDFAKVVEHDQKFKTGKIDELEGKVQEDETKYHFQENILKVRRLASQYASETTWLRDLEDSLTTFEIKILELDVMINHLKTIPGKQNEIDDCSDLKAQFEIYRNIHMNYLQSSANVLNSTFKQLKQVITTLKQSAEQANTSRKKLFDELKLIFSDVTNKLNKELNPAIKKNSLVAKLVEEYEKELTDTLIKESNNNKYQADYNDDKKVLDILTGYKNEFPEFKPLQDKYKNLAKKTIDEKIKVNWEYAFYELKLKANEDTLAFYAKQIEQIKGTINQIQEELKKPGLTTQEKTDLQNQLAQQQSALATYEADLATLVSNISILSQKLAKVQLTTEQKAQISKLQIELNKVKNEFGEELERLGNYPNDFKDWTKGLYHLIDPYKIINTAYRKTSEVGIELYKKLAFINANRKENELDLMSNEIFSEIKNEKEFVIAKTKIELREKLIKLGLITKDSTEADIDLYTKKVKLTNLEKSGSKLVVSVRGISSWKEDWVNFENNTTDVYGKFAFDAKANSSVISLANDMFSVLDYKKVVVPRILREEGDIKTEDGKLVKGYAIYTDGYENLLDEVLDKVPYAAQWLEGTYIDKILTDDGVIKYEVKNGKYLGFNKDSRVGLWAILKATNKNFKGISIDFLKFVAAHEYGHHMTLNGAQNLGDKNPDNKSVFVSALTPGATPGITNYYNKEALDLYLKARTNLQLTTRTYLNGKYVLDKNGEYPSFMFPKKNADGTISYEEEKTEDIWGTQINDPNVIKALKNEKRRFIQNFEGMKKALEERRASLGFNPSDSKGISLFDLWLTNTLDTFSGTLNPSVSGKAKYLVYDKVAKKYKFTEASLKMLSGILKDGKGNPIEFDEVTQKFKIAEYEYQKEDKATGVIGKFILKKVFINDANGQPIISAPLNKDLYYDANYGENAIQYILNKIKEVEDNIESLVVKKFLINGWDDSSTALTIEPKISIGFSKLAEFGKKAEDYEPTKAWYKRFVKERDFTKHNMTAAYFAEPTYCYENGQPYGKPLESLAGGWEKDNYFVDVNGTTLIQQLPKLMLGGWNGLKWGTASGFETHIDGENYVGNVASSITFGENLLTEDLGSALKDFGIQKTLNPVYLLARQILGNNLDSSLWLLLKADGTPAPNFTKQGLTAFVDTRTVKTIKFNASILNKNTKTSLFNSIYLLKGSNKLYGDEIEFDNLKDWFKFVSIDLTKAKLDVATKSLNWDLDYVKSKFNILAFKRGLKISYEQYKSSFEKSEQEYFEHLINKANEQELANEIMKRYSTSPLAAFTKRFKLKDLETNQDLMWVFDQNLGFGEYKTDKFNIFDPSEEKFEFGKDKLIKTFKDFATEFTVPYENLTSVDYLLMNSKISLQTEQMIACFINNKLSLIDLMLTIVNGSFKKVAPSADALNYFNSKNERRFNEFFTDYTYNFAEVINRDNLQITYTPPTVQFGNMPSYLSGISEATTGLEYVVDATDTKKWLGAVIKFNERGKTSTRKALMNSVLEFNKIENEEQNHIADSFNQKAKQMFLSDKSQFDNGHTFRNSYFGKLQINNNGWFKDRWYREFLDFKLYDDEGKDIVDPSIRIKDLEGKRVETRAKAYWEYYIQSQGVGKRSMSGIWRDRDKDAIAFYGYIPKHLTNKVKYLAFKDTKTGKVKTVALNIKNSNNMFYYKNQDIRNEDKAFEEIGKPYDQRVRHYISDEKYIWTGSDGKPVAGVGFDSYVSDYIIASKYSNTLLLPGHEYEIYFALDEKGTYGCEVYLGETHSISENGKTFSQAPTAIYKQVVNGKTKIILKIQDQFNIF